MKCEYCKKEIQREEWCDWNQGRCPHREKPGLSPEVTALLWTILAGLIALSVLAQLFRLL